MRHFAYASIVSETVEAIPELVPYMGGEWPDIESLPHPVWGNLAAFVIDQVRALPQGATCPSPGSPLGRALRLVEQAYSHGDLDVRNLVHVSFLENLDHAGPDLPRLSSFLSLHLQKELKRLGYL